MNNRCSFVFCLSIMAFSPVAFSQSLIEQCGFKPNEPITDLISAGVDLENEGYTATGVESVDEKRLIVHTSFTAAHTLIKRYAVSMCDEVDYRDFMVATKEMSDEDTTAYFDSLPIETKRAIIAYDEKNRSLLGEIGAVAMEIVGQQSSFQDLDFTSLAKSELSMWDLPRHLPKVISGGKFSYNEMAYLTKSIPQLSRAASQLSLFE